MKLTILLTRFSLAVILLLLFLQPALASSIEEKILRIQKTYVGIKDLKGSFSQKNTLKELKQTVTYKGEFFIKYPLKMKWVYKDKSSHDITINNNSILIHKRGENQAYRSKFEKSTYGQTPIALLSGFGNIREEFTITEKGDSLILKPRKPMGTVLSVSLKISEEGFPIHSFVIQDGNFNTIEIIVKDVQINTGIQDSMFDLSLPKGVEIYEQ